jgi:hypothetical protein
MITAQPAQVGPHGRHVGAGQRRRGVGVAFLTGVQRQQAQHPFLYGGQLLVGQPECQLDVRVQALREECGLAGASIGPLLMRAVLDAADSGVRAELPWLERETRVLELLGPRAPRPMIRETEASPGGPSGRL